MPDVTNLDVIRTVVYTQAADQAGLMVHHYEVRGASTPAPSLADCARATDTQLVAAVKACLSAQAHYYGVGARIIFPGAASVEEFGQDGDGAGDATGDTLPRFTSGIITLRTALPGRSHRGRKYVPFPTEAFNAAPDFEPNDTYLTLLNTLGVALVAPFTVTAGAASCTMNPVIYSRLLSNTFDITNYISRRKWGLQHRRGDYGRTNLPLV